MEVFFQSDSVTSLLTNLFHHSDVLPFFTQHDRFFFFRDLSANKCNCNLLCSSMSYCKITIIVRAKFSCAVARG